MYTVFLSSTFADFPKEREQLHMALDLIEQVKVIRAENIGSQGTTLDETLKYYIDQSKIVVLLIGSRSGTVSSKGKTWTETEIDYASHRGKRIFAYMQETPTELLSIADVNDKSKKRLDRFARHVEAIVKPVPRFKRGECCRLTALAVRDVTRHVHQLLLDQQEEDRLSSFTD